MSRAVVLIAAVLVVFRPVQSRELVVLNSGFSLEADSHVVEDGLVKFKAGEGTVQFAQTEIQEIRQLSPEMPAAAILRQGTVKDRLSPQQLVGAAALANGLPEAFVRSVAQVESGLLQRAVSVKGAIGLMQLMPATAAGLKVDPSLAESNALGGAAYLRQLLIQYRGDSGLTLAAYNAGPGAVKKFGGVPPYAETRRYILKVLAEYKRQSSLSNVSHSVQGRMPKSKNVLASTTSAIN